MFQSEVYIERRKKLRKLVSGGIILFPGNTEAAFNYKANTYAFRQDSSFLYFFGLDFPDLAGIIDLEEGNDIIFGNDTDMEDIVWMGPQPSIHDRAKAIGISQSQPLAKLESFIKAAIQKGRKVHYIPPYRGETILYLCRLLDIPPAAIQQSASVELIKAVVSLRSVKDSHEISEIEKAVDICWEMHTTAMKMARPGTREKTIAGVIEGIAASKGYMVSFPIILSIHGEILHNHQHGNILSQGNLMITDAGAESEMHYAGDITRTAPVGGKFNTEQRDIYNIVLKANQLAIAEVKPGVPYRDVHMKVALCIAQGMKDLGFMKGDMHEAVELGAHALFLPHGLGHHLGLDVHDMENLGEDYIGYDDQFKRSSQFGTAYLRLGKKLEPGFCITDEPGIYFIPDLIHQWKKENKFSNFIDYNKVESNIGFGGIRIEDDLLITPNGCKLLGKPIPKTVEEIENWMR
jgi:Xaa-Pro aminopeptidase